MAPTGDPTVGGDATEKAAAADAATAKTTGFDPATDAYVEAPWTLIEAYFTGQQLARFVRHQIESYNHFITHQIIKTIDMFNPVRIASDVDFCRVAKKHALEVFVTFGNFCIHRPQIHENNGAVKMMFPQEARLRNFTYSSTTTVDMTVKYVIRSGETLDTTRILYKVLPRVHIGKLPVMLKSSVCVLNQYTHFDAEQTGECKLDAGGYFVINGSEKTVLGQERPAENRVYCFNVEKTETKYTWKAEIKSVPDYKCISPKQIAMFVAAKNNGFGYPLVMDLPRVKQTVPLFVVFRALGVLADKDICAMILLDLDHAHNREMLEALHASILEASAFLTQEDCLQYIAACVMYTPVNVDADTGARKKREFAADILAHDLFPHCNTPAQKLHFVGYMAQRLLLAWFGLAAPDDRDSYLNKRVDLAGALLNNLYRNYFNKVVKDMEKHVVREINTGSWRSKDDYENIINMTNVYKIIKSSTIENGIKRALSTGDFGVKHSNSSKVGVAQVYNRLNYVSSLSHARRIATPSDKSGKLIPPRKLHSTSWGFLCPAETPEGASVGIVKNLAYMTHVTTASSTPTLYEYVWAHGVVSLETAATAEFTPAQRYAGTKVFVNGCWIGFALDPPALYAQLKRLKHQGTINVYTAIVFDYKKNEIRVCNDAGRLTRPLLRVVARTEYGDHPGPHKHPRSLLLTHDILARLRSGACTWDMLLTNLCHHHTGNEGDKGDEGDEGDEAVIEYIDPEEQNGSLVATAPRDLCDPRHRLARYTHCEIHPSTIFGVLASCIPFPEHNQSPRNTYQCAQGKQAMGIYATNYENRMDKTAYILNYPMRPLVDTRIMDLIQLNKIPSGSQLIVAIMTHTGYNQEDSLLLSQGAVDRGMALATVYHTEKDEDKQRLNGDEEIRCRPDPAKTKGIKMGNYSKVNARGVIPENTRIENRDIIIAKMTPIKENKNDPTKVIKYEDQSKLFKTTEETYVDRNYLDRNGEGYNFAKVRTRTMRKPVIGDKFSSRHGQKGTVGNIIPEQDMPFTARGVRPDIIINPHAIPSRMTIAQLKETLLGKVLVELGLFGDGTAFGDFCLQDIAALLQKQGYESYGNEVMYSGLTGEPIEYSIFIGPVFYQRLKHMVNDKSHSRSIGPMVNLTRQPAEGRSRDGGLRFGEMERDCMISHGAARFTRERMYDASDKYAVNICNQCGLIAAHNNASHIHWCRTCSNRADFSYVEIPYACKLLFQELNTMNIAPRLLTEA